MQRLRSILAAALLAAPLLVPGWPGGVPAVTAAPLGGDPAALCRRTYLPAIMRPAAAQAGAVPAGPAAIQALNAPCAGFPDFNGDGYADLAIGVPRKEVFDGLIFQVDAGIVQVVYGSPIGLQAGDGAAVEDQIWNQALAGVPAAAGDEYGRAFAMGDFNHDGFDDLAVGIPGARINGHNKAGAVQVIYGSAGGLTVANVQEWSRGHAGLSGTAAPNEGFGAALAAGDFDADGYTDLAVGVPLAVVGGDAGAGAVHILYGRALGLTALGDELLTQDTPGFLASPAEADDSFGFALAAADFNADGVDDLAVAAPSEDNGASYADAGAVQVFFGQAAQGPGDYGLIRLGSVKDPQHWTADSPYVEGAMEAGELFGTSLAAADFNGDGYADLAVGIPQESHGSGAGAIANGGSLNIISGGAAGLEATAANPARLWHQESTDMDDEVAEDEVFGYALAAADFDNDGYADLAIGVPQETTFGVAIGAAHLMYGSSQGLTASGDGLLFDPDNPEAYDVFGASLSAGDFDGDGFTDLVVGAFADDPVGVDENGSGSVFVFYSDAAGVSQTVHQNWYPGNLGLRGTPATNDYFGSALPGSPDLP